MVGVVRGLLFLMQGDDGVGHEIHRNDVNAISRAEGQDPQTCQEDEGLDHVELGGFPAAAVAQDDAGAEDGAGHVGEQFSNHVLAKFLGAGVGVVVGAVPVDGLLLAHHFVRALAGDGDGADVADAAQAVEVAGGSGQLDHFQGAAQVDVEAAFLRLTIERSGAVDDRVGGVDQTAIVVVGQAELRVGQVAQENGDARVEEAVEAGEVQVKLQGAPEAKLRLTPVLGAHKQVERIGVTLQQARHDVAADVAGGAGQEDGHVASGVKVWLPERPAGRSTALLPVDSSNWKARRRPDSGRRPSMSG